jgi:transposase
LVLSLNLASPWQGRRRKAWPFAGSELADQRAAVVLNLVPLAELHGRDPWANLKEVLELLSTHMNNRVEELLPQRWQT